MLVPCRSAQLDLDPRLFSWLTSLQRLVLSDDDRWRFLFILRRWHELCGVLDKASSPSDVWITSYLITHCRCTLADLISYLISVIVSRLCEVLLILMWYWACAEIKAALILFMLAVLLIWCPQLCKISFIYIVQMLGLWRSLPSLQQKQHKRVCLSHLKGKLEGAGEGLSSLSGILRIGGDNPRAPGETQTTFTLWQKRKIYSICSATSRGSETQRLFLTDTETHQSR